MQPLDARRALAAIGAGRLTPLPTCDDHRRPTSSRAGKGETLRLYGIDPILGPDLLSTLRAMGHGDEICIADANFPAVSNARRLIRVDAADAVRVADAILSLMPLDTFVPNAAFVMQVVGKPKDAPPVYDLFQKAIDARQKGFKLARIERFKFYERARTCFAIVATGERRLYGNLILTKGIVRPEEQ
jgi:L-fucose mutarotase